MKDVIGREICDLCDKPLNGHCVYFPDLGIFCESCLRMALRNALREWPQVFDNE